MELQVWQLRMGDVSASDLRRGLAWLDAREVAYYEACRSVERKRQFALGRLLLRGALSHLSGDRKPGEWRIVPGLHGRPVLAAGQPFIGFNLAHSAERIVLATGSLRMLGIDIEYGRERRNIEGLARRWFHSSEFAQLMRLAPSARPAAFYRLWTLKEASAKALGGALAPSLRRFKVSVDETGGFAVAMEGGAGVRWQFFQLDTEPDYYCALACRCDREIALTSRRMCGLWRFNRVDTLVLGSAEFRS